MSKKYIGVMSGTSLDGIDIVLCDIGADSCTALYSGEYKFDKKLKTEILDAISSPVTLEFIGRLDTRLGELFASCINEFLKQNNINKDDVKAIGLHGQTLWHEPNGEFPFSMQLGDPNVVSARNGIKVVADFRRMDIAQGGQGAPFAPVFHKEIFRSLGKQTAVLNIGGIANITLLNKELKGYDTGPGNVLMDYWINECKGLPYDKNGSFAASGEVDDDLLNALLSDEYFKKPSPKSTGREYFNPAWLAKHMPLFQSISDEDVQRTLLELSTRSIAYEVIKSDTELLIVCGGGSKNELLMKRLSELTKIQVKKSDDYGVDSDFVEAMAFAWLAYKRINNEKVELSSVTGAIEDSVLGGIYG